MSGAEIRQAEQSRGEQSRAAEHRAGERQACRPAAHSSFSPSRSQCVRSLLQLQLN